MTWKRQKFTSLYLWPSLSFFIPAFVFFFYFIYRHVWPFGGSTIMTTDMGQQYVDFFAYYQTTLLHHPDQLLYSFSKGLGGSMVGSWAYYLASPFNLILLMFNGKLLPFGLYIITGLKIGVAGLSQWYYLKKVYAPLQASVQLALSIAYALCSFVVVYHFNLMWLDCIYLLPLICLGIEQLLLTNRSNTMLIPLTFAFIIQYYLAYMIGLFAALYACYRMIYHFGFRFKDRSSWKLWLQKIGQFLLVALEALGLAAFILLPTIIELWSTKATYNATTLNWQSSYSPLLLLQKLAMGSYNFHQMSSGQGNIFTGSLVIIGACLFWFLPHLNRQIKWVTGFITLFLIVSLFFNPFILLWHMGQFPVWYPDRFSFILSFWLIELAAQSFSRLNQLPLYAFGGALVVLATYLIYDAANLTSNETLTTQGLITSVFFTMTIFLLLLFAYNQKHPWNILITIVSCVSVLEMGTNLALSLNRIQYTTLAEYWNYTRTVNQALAKLPALHQQGVRLEKTFNRTNDDAMEFGYYGGSHFNSMLDPQMGKFYDAIGESAGDNYIHYLYGTEFTDSLLGFSYFLTNNQQSASTLDAKLAHLSVGLATTSYRPDVLSYQFKSKMPYISIYKNPYALPLIFSASNLILTSDFVPSDPIMNQNRLMMELSNDDNLTQLYTRVDVHKVSFHNAKASGTSDFDNSVTYSKLNRNEPAYVEWTFTPHTQDPYYLELATNDKRSNVTLSINNQSIPLADDFRAPILLNLANNQNGSSQTIRFYLNTNHFTFQTIQIYRFEQQTFKQRLRIIRQQQAYLTQFNNHQIKATVQVKKNNLITTTIPYDQGWHATLDGHPVKTVNLLGTFLGIKTSPGRHQLVLTFWPIGWWSSLSLSLLTLLLLIGTHLRIHFKHKKAH